MSSGRLFTIPPDRSFVDALAEGLLDLYPDPLVLGQVRLLLPTRRAGRSLREAFLRRCAGAPLLLPRMTPLGDLDAEEMMLEGEGLGIGWPGDALMEPAFPPLGRQLRLAELVTKWHGGEIGADQAALLAAELGRLLDQVETEGLDFGKLPDLVEEQRYAEHWGLTLRFLEIVTENWPEVEREAGVMGAAKRRRLLLEHQAKLWREQPPEGPVIAAGSTGSIPATADLIGVVADLPQGTVILPGLDGELDEEVWLAVREDPTHPQHGLALLMERMNVRPSAVETWPYEGGGGSAPLRGRLVNAALLPAPASERWRALPFTAEAVRQEALAGVKRLDLPDAHREAAVVALLLRETLEIPGKTAALVTPDRNLARRVASALSRWGLEIDDTAGLPLSGTPVGAFLRAVAAMVEERFAPVALLAALKHPLAAGGEAPGAFRRKVRLLEVGVLRGPRPAPGIEGLRRVLENADRALTKEERREVEGLLDRLENALAPFAGALRDRAALPVLVRAHIASVEALAASDDVSGAERLWSGEAGEAAAGFLQELAGADPGLAGPGGAYPALLEVLLQGRSVRRSYGGHPRLHILGPLEARLWHADRMILGGLNEGTWPSETDPGPWMSRPMRKDFGLPPVERRIGLAAHDFVQAFAAPEVFLTRAERVEGQPSVPSRWLLRLEAVLDSLGIAPETLTADTARLLAWAEVLDAPEEVKPWPRPGFAPPLEARPAKLSVTRVETWIRDPYALYAEQVLGLRKLEDLDADAGAAEQGEIIHEILERFTRSWPESLPDDPLSELLKIGEQVFAERGGRPAVTALWWPRFERAARWVVGEELKRRAEVSRVVAECHGTLDVDGLVLSAKADRIEVLRQGGLAITDYKTGAPPNGKQVERGLAPQLPLEAAIAQAGGFPEVEAAAVGPLLYWRIQGRRVAGKVLPVGEGAELGAAALEGLKRFIAAYRDPSSSYLAQPRPGLSLRYNDYAHLERVAEWSAGEEGDGE